MKLLIFTLFAVVALAQVTPPTTMQFVTSAPAGACASPNLPIQYVTTTGSMYGCVSGTWTSVGGGGGGGITGTGTAGQITYWTGSSAVGGFGTNSGSVTSILSSVIGPATLWTLHTVPEANSWSGVAYGNSKFVAVAYDGAHPVMTSPDGVAWTSQSAPTGYKWVSVCFGSGIFVALSDQTADDHQVMTSPDGITWTLRDAASSSRWSVCAFGAGLFVAVAHDGMDTSRIMTSPDGITWTPIAGTDNGAWYGITYGNGQYVVVGDTGGNHVMTSPDGAVWTVQTVPSNPDLKAIAYGNGRFVAVGSSSGFWSIDGILWYDSSFPTGAAQPEKIIFADESFISLSSNFLNAKNVLVTQDGISWRLTTTTKAYTWEALAVGNHTLVAVNDFDVSDAVATASSLATINLIVQ